MWLVMPSHLFHEFFKKSIQLSHRMWECMTGNGVWIASLSVSPFQWVTVSYSAFWANPSPFKHFDWSFLLALKSTLELLETCCPIWPLRQTQPRHPCVYFCSALVSLNSFNRLNSKSWRCRRVVSWYSPVCSYNCDLSCWQRWERVLIISLQIVWKGVICWRNRRGRSMVCLPCDGCDVPIGAVI